MVDVADLKFATERCAGSIPAPGTIEQLEDARARQLFGDHEKTS